MTSAILRLLMWLDQSPARYWTGVCLCYGFCIFLAILPFMAREEGNELGGKWRKWILNDLLFVLSMFAAVFFCRWPFLMYPRYIVDPDEATFISCGIGLWHDPIFWRSTSSGTSGPLNIYPLLIPKLLGFSFGYAPARVMGLVLVAGTISCLYFAARKFMDRALARLTVLPILTFFAFTVNRGFIHYGSEDVPMFLLSASILTLAVLASSPRRHGWMIFAAGMVVGAAPFAKLQATPMGAALGLLVLWLCQSPLKNRFRDCAIYAAGAMVVPLFFLTTTIAAGGVEHMLNSYLMANAGYARQGLSLAGAIAAFPEFLAMGTTLRVWLYFQLAAGALLVMVVWMSGGRKSLKSFSLKLPVFSAVLLIVALYSVIAPGRHYAHYLLFLTIPSVLWLTAGAACFGQWAGGLKKPRRIQAVTTLLVVWVIAVVSTLALNEPADGRPLGRLEEFTTYPGNPTGNAIRNLGLSGRSMAVWGWMNELFIETNMWPATSDSVLAYSWVGTGHPEDKSRRETLPNYLEAAPGYFRNLFIQDLERNRPPVFVDAVSPQSFTFQDRNLFGYETFPALAALVDSQYRLIIEVDGARIFLRNDLQPPVPVVAQWEASRRLLAQQRELLRSRPDDVAVLNNAAWVLATSQDASVRNAAEAIELAQRAVGLSGAKEAAVLGTLAAAYAEARQFPKAIETAQQALALAGSQNDMALAGALRTRMALYQNNSPYRELEEPSPPPSGHP